MRKVTSQTKRDYIWNTIAGFINAFEAVGMSIVVTRITGLTDAGMLTIAFAVGNLMMSIGKFGVRNYQVTDIENRFFFSTYLKARLVTVSLMTMLVVIYLVYASAWMEYDRKKIDIIFLICMIYAVETIEDVFWGYYQRKNRMDAGAKMFCFRWMGILSVFYVMLWILRDLKDTLVLCLIVSIAIFCVMLHVTYRHICSERDKSIKIFMQGKDIYEIRELLRRTFPLFGIAFLSLYVNNAPKYAIDACLSDEVQACYGFVAMPVFVIGLLNNFIYQPTLVPMAEEWEYRQDKKFIRRVFRQLEFIAGISIICLGGAYIFGVPILSWIYHTDLISYKNELMILMVAGSFLAVSGYLSVVLTIMRCQNVLLWPYCTVALIAFVSLKKIVSKYGTCGAAVCYLTLMVLLCSLYSIMLMVRIQKDFGKDIKDESNNSSGRTKKYNQ